MRRAARYFATSSKKSMCALKKKERRGAKSSTSRPRSIAASTYAKPSASVNATSCPACEPSPQPERALLRRGLPRLPDVVAGDRDRMHPWQLPGAILDHVDHEPHRRL